MQIFRVGGSVKLKIKLWSPYKWRSVWYERSISVDLDFLPYTRLLSRSTMGIQGSQSESLSLQRSATRIWNQVCVCERMLEILDLFWVCLTSGTTSRSYLHHLSILTSFAWNFESIDSVAFRFHKFEEASRSLILLPFCSTFLFVNWIN